jgi:hypothetical protein
MTARLGTRAELRAGDATIERIMDMYTYEVVRKVAEIRSNSDRRHSRSGHASLTEGMKLNFHVTAL